MQRLRNNTEANVLFSQQKIVRQVQSLVSFFEENQLISGQHEQIVNLKGTLDLAD